MIDSFRVEHERVIGLAECQKVPKIMIIAGPNGIGKSTLLFALKRKQGVQGDGKILYMPPHRAWHRQKIRTMYLLARRLKYTDFLVSDSMPGVEGLQLRGLPRRFDSLDESPTTIKNILGQFETRRRDVIAKILDQKGSVTRENMPDIYEPLRKLINFFLPHLEFSRIDLSTPDDVKCVFKHLYHQTDEKPIEIDIDDLSSGEREVITLFLNFIEQEINKILAEFEGTVSEPLQDIVMLIDSPELHLHPALQRRLLNYVREITREGKVQFIMTTHSPILVNEATSDELYVLIPPERMKGYNQLVKISNEADRLETIRNITGETFSLTLGKPLILIEGRPPALASREPSDSRLLELMCPKFSAYSLVPFYEKKRIQAFVKELSDSADFTSLGLLVFAIIDNDRDAQTYQRKVDRVFVWPACTIENFLLDPCAIWEVIQPHREKLGWKESADVLKALEDTALELKDQEIRLRIEEQLGQFKWSLRGNCEDDIEHCFREGERRFSETFGNKEKRNIAIQKAKDEVEKIISDKTMLQCFSGKEILKKFHSKFIGNLGLNYQAFAYQVAERIGRKATPTGITKVKTHIDSFIPWSLPSVLEDLLQNLEDTKTAVSVPTNIVSDLINAKSEAQLAVEEAKSLSEVKINRGALKEKCWINLTTLRQHLEGQTKSSEIENLIKKIELAITETAAIVSISPLP